MKTKTLKITTDDKISVIEVDVNNIKDLQNAIGGGLVEPVKTQKLWDYFKAPVLMLVDEEGLLKDLSQKDHNSRHRITVDSDQWVMMDSRIFRMISMKNCRLTRW